MKLDQVSLTLSSSIRGTLFALAIIVALSPAGSATAGEIEYRQYFQGCTDGILNRVCSYIGVRTSRNPCPISFPCTLDVDVTHWVTSNGVLRQGSMTGRFVSWDYEYDVYRTAPDEYCDWNGITEDGCATSHETLKLECSIGHGNVKLSISHDASSNLLNSVILTRQRGSLVRYLDPCTGRTRATQ